MNESVSDSCVFACFADRVFGPECETQKVYEEGAKHVALSALAGLNCKYLNTINRERVPCPHSESSR